MADFKEGIVERGGQKEILDPVSMYWRYPEGNEIRDPERDIS